MTAFIIFFSIITPIDNYNSILKSTKMKKYRNHIITSASKEVRIISAM